MVERKSTKRKVKKMKIKDVWEAEIESDKLYVYEVWRNAPGVGAISMGLFSTLNKAKKAQQEWGKVHTHPWDGAQITKREIR